MEKVNVVIAGHTSVGKTLFLDTALYDIGAADAIGKVDEGKSLSDYDEEEIKRKLSIHSSVFSMDVSGSTLNLIDTPGSSDFIGEVASSFYGVESVLLLVDAVNGIEIGTSKIFTLAQNQKLPVMVFVNKMDKEHADYEKALKNIGKNLKTPVIPLQIPIGKEAGLKGVIDLLKMKAFISEADGKKPKIEDIPPELSETAKKMRNDIIEAAAESSDELTEKYLEGESLTDEEINKGINKRLADGQVIPVLFGSALLNRGVKEALECVVSIAPRSNYKKMFTAHDAADGSKEVEIERSASGGGIGIVFKTVIDQFAGKMTFLRVLSGSFDQDQDVLNNTRNKKERLSKPARPFGKNQIPLNRKAEEGDIVVFAKLPEAETGDTLSAPDRQVVAPKLVLPNPVHSVAIKAKEKKEGDKLSALLQKAAEEDISFTVQFNKETKQTVISGMGELQFGIILSRIKEKQHIDYETSTPLVAYRETISSPSKADYKHKKQSGGHGQYGQVFLEIEPLKRGVGFEFEDKIVGGAIPKQYIPGVEKGVKEAMEVGVVAGYPVVDVKVSLVFGSFHDVDSSELAFKIAGRQAFKLAMEAAKPTLLEPVMDLNVYVNDKYTGDIMSDLNSKRGRVLGMDNVGGGIQLIKAKVPQAELLKYSIELRSITSGTGTFEMSFSHYDPITGKIAEEVIKETKQRMETEAS
ncbi:MAG: elongation factor G [Spirochaetes bacterium]|nr:elongation factor G [Spirochaetota bacterium]